MKMAVSEADNEVTKADLRETELRLMKWTATVVGVAVALLALLKFV